MAYEFLTLNCNIN